jgi:hypothetical protein
MAGNSRSGDVKVNIKTDNKSSIKSMAAMAAAVTAAYMAIKKVVHVVGEMEAAYAKQNAAETKLTAALRATRGAVGYTTRELTGMASEMQRLTTIGDDEVISAQALMTTFTQIGHDVFPDAIKAAADMSVMFGQDLSQSSIQLGTALNDPIAGIGRLKRIGISFTEDQKASIQTFMDQNDIMGAQRIILDELTAEFGGVAEEVGKTNVKAAVDLGTAMSDLTETFGRMITDSLAPARRNMAEYVTKINEAIIATQNFQRVMNEGFSSGVGDDAPMAVLLDAAKNVGTELEDALNYANKAVQGTLNEGLFQKAGRIFMQLWGKETPGEGDITALIARIAANNNYIKVLQERVDAENKLAGSTETASEADIEILAIWDKLTTTLRTISRMEADRGAAYDAEAETAAAVALALLEMNQMDENQIRNKAKLIELYGEYLPTIDQEAVLLGEATEAGQTYLKNLLDIKFQIWALQDARAEAAEKAAAAEQSAALDTAGAWIGAFSDMAGANKKWIAFQKAAALAQIVFNTAVAVTEALKIPIYGEIKAAAIIAAGIGQSAAVLAQDVPQLAGGGIVNKPTLALIGENGPEAVVPLGRGGGGGRPVVVNINAGMVATQMQVENWVASIARRVG